MKIKMNIVVMALLIAIGVFVGCSKSEPGALQLAWPPADEAVDPNPILQWQPFVGIGEYRVIVTEAGADKALFDQRTAETNIPVTPALNPGSYTWHVDAFDETGKVLAVLDSTFSVKDAIGLISPVAFDTVGTEPELKWQPFPGAVSYHVTVINDTYPPEVVCEHTTADTSYTVSPPLVPANYSWRVWAFDNNNRLVAELNSNIVVQGAE
ncbi:MAG: hypothetical protein WAM60_01895 [Candidatus Promineifilaceae bacterium]